MKTVIIGSGNVAEALARALAANGTPAVQVWARSEERGREVARLGESCWAGTKEELAEAELYLISVSDRAIAEVAAALPFPKGAIVAHTAGCGTLEMLPEGVHRDLSISDILGGSRSRLQPNLYVRRGGG